MAFALNPRLIFSALSPNGLPRIINSGGINEIAEASGQSFKAGQLVYNNSGIAACAADATSVLGIAMEDAVGTGYATHYPEVVVLGPGDRLEITWTSSAGTETPVVGTCYGLTVASNKSKLDYDEVTTKLWRVEKILDATLKRCVVICNNTAALWQYYAV